MRWLLTYSFPSCLGTKYLEVFEFVLLLTKVVRDFAYLELEENELNKLMRLFLLRTMLFSDKLGPKEKL